MTDLINLNKFLNNAIGFESFFERFHRYNTINAGFPHYNIKKVSEDKYILEMAVAGYKKSDVEVLVQDGVLSIEGKVPLDPVKELERDLDDLEENEEFIHKGIARRSFKRQLQLAEYVECKGAKLEDGMLKVELNYNPPEDKKPKKITIK
jgi:molecular chaperone IbpA